MRKVRAEREATITLSHHTVLESGNGFNNREVTSYWRAKATKGPITGEADHPTNPVMAITAALQRMDQTLVRNVTVGEVFR